MFKYALFDLDGTLTDPSVGITSSIMYALEKMGRDVPTREELYRFIGPPLVPAFREFLGMTEAESADALRFYREYFTERGMLENRPYDGIADTLAALRASGIIMAVATSKPEPFARKICAHFGLAEYFCGIYGATLDEKRTNKSEVIAYAAAEMGIGTENTVMVGDRKHDVEGAHTFGIPAVGVLWGFGTLDELTSSHADYIACNIPSLVEIIR